MTSTTLPSCRFCAWLAVYAAMLGACSKDEPDSLASSRVLYVFPAEFTGIAKIISDSERGTAPPTTNGETIISLPETGELILDRPDPLRQWHVIRFEDSNGVPLICKGLRDEPMGARRDVVVAHLGYLRDGAESWYYMGDPEGIEAAYWRAVEEDQTTE